MASRDSGPLREEAYEKLRECLNEVAPFHLNPDELVVWPIVVQAAQQLLAQHDTQMDTVKVERLLTYCGPKWWVEQTLNGITAFVPTEGKKIVNTSDGRYIESRIVHDA